MDAVTLFVILTLPTGAQVTMTKDAFKTAADCAEAKARAEERAQNRQLRHPWVRADIYCARHMKISDPVTP